MQARTGCWWGSPPSSACPPSGSPPPRWSPTGRSGGCTGPAEPFDPDGAQATAARASATKQVSALADRLVAGHEILANATDDGCMRGYSDLQYKETYAEQCSVLASRLVLVTTDRDDVPDGLRAADAALTAVGCRPAYDGITLDWMRQGYWDDSNPNVHQCGAAGLPGTRYRCADDLEVAVTPTSNRGRKIDPPVSADPVLLDEMLHGDWYTGRRRHPRTVGRRARPRLQQP